MLSSSLRNTYGTGQLPGIMPQGNLQCPRLSGTLRCVVCRETTNIQYGAAGRGLHSVWHIGNWYPRNLRDAVKTSQKLGMSQYARHVNDSSDSRTLGLAHWMGYSLQPRPHSATPVTSLPTSYCLNEGAPGAGDRGKESFHAHLRNRVNHVVMCK